ncbi:HTH-type transcriptional regulator CueR [Vibrio thalassae]|uniref:HTH-type transcriptional regulator CueR n=1 Tax=Vibrio thalassae TaxID=1243014 RepID=A0A240EF89_9VIBR|nr:MerR family transcriptional regulator [Vibrio thalassae]SNX47354.1 HTH-type transcriptional regulator CueR [Vibrio thalassae]
MKIGQVSEITGLTTKTIRFYEERQIISPPKRTINGYRFYTDEHVRELSFISNARKAGFSLDECQYLLSLEKDTHRRSESVRQFASDKLLDVQNQIEALKKVEKRLAEWIKACPGNEQSYCPIINKLKKGG